MMKENQQLNNRFCEDLRESRPMRSAPEGFAHGVMRRIEKETRGSRRSGPPFNWFRLLAAGAAVLLAGAVFWKEFGRSSPQPSEAFVIGEPELQMPVPPIRTEALLALPARLDEPLEKELRLLIADTRNAVDYLAGAFVPQPPQD